VASAPFPEDGPYNRKARIRSFLTEYLAEEIRMDLTKKQVARDGVSWTVRAATGDEPTNRTEGVVEAKFWEGKIKALRLRAGIRAG
jgi:NTE family protein